MDTTDSRHPLHRMILKLPVLGHVIRCLEAGRVNEAGLVLLNILLAIMLATLFWGYSALLIAALVAAALAGLLVLATTVG